MISDTEILETGPMEHRCQVVRWVRSFPFSFLSRREYVIGRRMFREAGCLYGITKVCPLLPPSLVREFVNHQRGPAWLFPAMPTRYGHLCCETTAGLL